MSKPSLSHAKTPDLMKDMKYMVNGPDTSDERAYIFARNILMLPC